MLALAWVIPVSAQEYVLDKGDLVSVTFWQQPDLNARARIDAEGKIDLPLAGRLVAAGLTVDQLSRRIVERMAIYNSKITQASIAVEEYGSRKIFVTGAVGAPGKFSFEKLPNIWEAILEAGGPLPTAQLDRVQLIRGGEGSGKITEVNLTAAFESGEMKGLPILNPGDNVNVPGAATTTPGGAGNYAAAGATQKNSIYIFGFVVAPGIYRYEKDMNVLQAIIQAGGPVYQQGAGGSSGRPTPEPDLKNVKIISLGLEAPVVYSVDIENYANRATPLPLTLRPGDTVYIPARENYRRFLLVTTLGEVIKGTIAIVTSYLLLDQLFNSNNNP